jgi:sugar lactone lactonase YvrE
MFLTLAGAFVVFVTAAAAKGTFPEEIPLPTGFRPEGIAIGNGTTFYVGSIPTGAVYRGDLRTGEGSVLVPGAAGRAAIGVRFDRGLLYVAGGGTGKGFVYDAGTGALVRDVQLAGGMDPSFVNDVVVTGDAAYFTDLRRPALYRLPLANDGTPGTAATVVPIAGGGYVHEPPPANNLNGIDATPDGKSLVVVQADTGKLFRVDAATGTTTEIDLGGATLVNGDGILLHGRTLYVVRNRNNQVAVVTLNASLSSGVVAPVPITDADLDVPTTIGRFGSHLYAVNAKFGTAQPTADTAPYEVVKVDR